MLTAQRGQPAEPPLRQLASAGNRPRREMPVPSQAGDLRLPGRDIDVQLTHAVKLVRYRSHTTAVGDGPINHHHRGRCGAETSMSVS